MVSRGEWSDYEKEKKKEYSELVRKAREGVYLCKRAPMAGKSK
jgi:hypothetical protein